MKGFTLIEIVVAFLVVGIVSSISIASFSSYNNSQVFNGSVSEVVNTLNVARSRAISQVKPSSCGSSPLEGYEIGVTPAGSTYEQRVVCGGIRTVLERKRLAGTVLFTSSSVPAMLFNVSSGGVNNPGSVTISGFGKSSIVSVDRTGAISVRSVGAQGVTPIPEASPTVVPGPTVVAACSQPAYRLYPAPIGCYYVSPGYGDYCDATCGSSQISNTQTPPTSTPTPQISTSPVASNTPSTPTPTPVESVGQPDLVITSISIVPTNPSRNAQFQTVVTVKNEGTVSTAGAVYIGVYFDKPNPTYTTTVNTQAAISASIPPGGSQTATAVGVFTASGSHTIHAIVDRTQTISESNESNNVGGPITVNIAKNYKQQKLLASLGLNNIKSILGSPAQ